MEISPGKGNILRSIPAASTSMSLLSKGFAVMCLLTRPQRPPYAVSIRRYGPLQSRFLQCRGHPQPPCALLTGPAYRRQVRQLAGKGLAPSGYSKNDTTLR